MEDYSILYFSLLSKNAKKLIKALQLKTRPIFLTIGHTVELFFCSVSIKFYGPNHQIDQESVRMLSKPENVEVLISLDDSVLDHYINLDMQLKDWIEHVLYIYNQWKLYCISFDVGYQRYDLEAIKKAVLSYEEIKIDKALNDASANVILNAYPHADGLDVQRNIFGQNQMKWWNLFIEHFEMLDLNDAAETPFEPMDFNSLLMCNAKHLRVEKCILSEKEVNCFLKLWTKGAHLRMEFLYIGFLRETISMEAIIRGLKCRDVNTTEQFTFKHTTYNICDATRTVAMFDIFRHDGIKGTIVFRDNAGLVLDFLVYLD
ncbi:hypothetical protein CAEBREN_18473 [Caenorhabditis brenneri]|uniref:Sdz-33 F-box domain-containing protein n=1 Tax=Caenorhabditis brenneri TaxID=135651 RepID=G0MC91_CAEBE|nr:hypothetical protein CAEBREN_18473 [Caenorhabditis brenneri]